jgi:serine/threonine protein kinase
VRPESFLRIGEELTPGYKLRQLRGKGSFGCVWEAVNDQGATLALKVLPCNDSLATTREIRALQAVRHLNHPHLIRIEQVWSQPGSLVIGMELADGSLLDLLEAYQSEYNTTLAPEETCGYLVQVAKALDYMNAHQHVIDSRRVGFQHSDIKPSNLLLIGETVKLGDLGSSALIASTVAAASWSLSLDYASPEVLQGRLSDWSDQYSLAITYCQLRSGRLPYPAIPNPFPRGYIRPPADLSMLTPREKPIIARALAMAPQLRWPTCGEMMAELVTATTPEKTSRRNSDPLIAIGR